LAVETAAAPVALPQDPIRNKESTMDSVVDVIKHAIENEVRAKTFYAKAADIAEDGESHMVFIELIDMEDLHARRLVEGFGSVLADDGVDGAAFLAGLEADVEKTLVNEQIELLKNAEIRPVLDFAIQMEANARDAYLGLKDRLDTNHLKALCQQLADEEQAHFDQLTEARSGVDTPPDERPML